jgi:fatty-acyl-CoA synthase
MECTPEEIVAHGRSLLASFKVPKAVHFCELPKNPKGKFSICIA